jgi:hypothetical protein
MSGRRPKARMEYKSKDGTRYEIAAVWGGKIDWADNVSPQKENVAHEKYPKMKMSDAVKRVEAGDGFLNLVYPKQDKPQPRNEPDPDDFSDDIGF